MLQRLSLTIVVISSTIFAAAILHTWMNLPNAEEVKRIARSTHIRVQKPENTNDRVELIELQTISYVSIDNIPDELLYAVVASEDHRFYTRPRVYMVAKALQAATYCLIKMSINSSGKCVGNSTITQQLVKLLLVS